MGRRSERLSKQGILASELAGESDVIQVVSRAFDILRCFEGHDVRLGNLEISNRCGLPRSTVSRLTHTLTRMGQLAYLPADQKYRVGPSAVAMSTSLMRGLQVRNLIRLRLQEVAERVPGTIGLVVPDRHHMVYLEYARAEHALGLHSVTGSRIAMASTAAGHAYVAALDEAVGDALIAEISRDDAESGRVLRETVAAGRQSLAEHGYVITSGLWTPHISGIAVPIWSPQYQTFVVVTIGVLSAMFDEQRLSEEIGPIVLALSEAVGQMVQSAEDGLHTAPAAKLPATSITKETMKTGNLNELEAGTRRALSPRSIYAGDGRR